MKTQLISNVLKQYRKENDLSQEKLAQRLGVCFRSVNRWERQLSKPSSLALQKIYQLIKNNT